MPTTGCQINVMIDPEKRDLFKRKAHGEGRTINELVNEWIDGYLSDLNSNQPNLNNLDDLIEERVQSAIADKLDSILDRLDRIESSPVTPKPIIVPEIEEDSPESESIKIESLSHATPDNEGSPIEEKTEGLEVKIEGSLTEDKQKSEDSSPIDSQDEDFPVEKVKEGLKGQKGLTNVALAQILGIEPTLITRWKKGERIPKSGSKYEEAYKEFQKWELIGEGWVKKD